MPSKHSIQPYVNGIILADKYDIPTYMRYNVLRLKESLGKILTDPPGGSYKHADVQNLELLCDKLSQSIHGQDVWNELQLNIENWAEKDIDLFLNRGFFDNVIGHQLGNQLVLKTLRKLAAKRPSSTKKCAHALCAGR